MGLTIVFICILLAWFLIINGGFEIKDGGD